jgi:predicted RNase H-like nuclease
MGREPTWALWENRLVRVVGLDACPSGWIAVVLTERATSAHFLSDVSEVTQLGFFDVIGIDIPIGFPESGYRVCDALGKALLGPRASTLFPVPVREALAASTHEEATALARERSGAGLSRQSYGLRAKIFEVDEWLTNAPSPVYEVHPELSFLQLTGRVLDSKKTWAGLVDRQTALHKVGIDLTTIDPLVGRRAQPDDVVDAGVVAWTARRLGSGEATSLGTPPAPSIWR